MKHQYDYRINPPMPSNEQMDKHKNFQAILEKYQKAPEKGEPTILRWLVVAASIAAISAGVLFFFQNWQKDYFELEQEYFANLEFVNPPFSNLEKKFKTIQLNSSKGGEFKGIYGSKYSIPANSLTDRNGNPVSGEVTIHYREMHDYVDFFISGIPMTYDSADVRYQFESAGMVEIFAEQKGKRLNVSPENPIRVELVTEISIPEDKKIPDFNIYKLSVEERNWTFQDVENSQTVEITEKKNAIKKSGFNGNKDLIDQINLITQNLPKPIAPVKPQKANGNNFVFDFKFTSDDFLKSGQVTQEESDLLFKNFEGALWQVKSGENVSSADLKKNWEDAKIRLVTNQDFELTLIQGEKKLVVLVNPVISGEKYQTALSQYELLQNQYQENLRLWEQEYSSQVAAAKSKFNTGQTNESPDFTSEVGFEMVRITNKFAITSFGIWNCDHPYLPEGDYVNGRFVDENQQEYENHTAYLVDKSRNTLVRFYATEGAQVRYNEKSENLIWVVTPNNQLAVFRPEEFEKLENLKEEKFTFLLDVAESPIATEEDIRKILHF